jgi:Zn-dependent protease with chaperone function
MKKSTLPIIALLLLLAGVGMVLIQKRGDTTATNGNFKLTVPKVISCDDFQREADRELMERLHRAEGTEICARLDTHFVKPFIDDVRTRSFTIDGLEVTKAQFPALHSIVLDCARVLHITKPPRVFVVERTGLVIGVENFSEPVIVINTTVLRRFKDQRELRFLIGRELGHVVAGHGRWQTLLRSVQSTMNRLGIGGPPVRLAILPLLDWAREAEMSADNAGLVCTRDVMTAERTLVRLATGIDDFSLHDVKVDEYLKQGDAERLSDFSDLALFWKELNRPAPFAAKRIQQLRDYSESTRYRSLWK